MVFWTGRQEQYRTTPLQLMWGLMYPWLIYEGASILVTAAYMVFRMMMDPSLLASMKDTDQYIRTMNSLINENYVLIAFFTCLIAIPLMLLRDPGPLREARERAEWEARQAALAAAATPEPTPPK